MIDCRKEKKIKCRNIFLIEVFNFEWKFYLEFKFHFLYQMERLLYPKGKSCTDLYNIWIQIIDYPQIKFVQKVFEGLVFQIIAGMQNISLHSEISPLNLPHSKVRGSMWWQNFHAIPRNSSCKMWSYSHICFLFLSSLR